MSPQHAYCQVVVGFKGYSPIYALDTSTVGLVIELSYKLIPISYGSIMKTLDSSSISDEVMGEHERNLFRFTPITMNNSVISLITLSSRVSPLSEDDSDRW